MEADVLKAAEVLMRAFAANDRNGYFAAFAVDATFIFHSVNHVLRSRADYEAEYDSWVDDGFAVLECSSFNRTVKLYGDVAVFTHETFIRAIMRGEESEIGERETIVFRRMGETWLAVHEHMSLLPG
jgi:ketosteroid isomerase-like protein